MIYAKEKNIFAQVRIGQPVYGLLSHKYYFDELYEKYLVGRVIYASLARYLDWADRNIIDGVVKVIDRLGGNFGRAVAQLQTGQLQGYAFGISIGVVAIFGLIILLR